MSVVELIPYVVLGSLFLVAAAIPLFGTGLLLQIGRSIKTEPFPLIFWLIAVVIVIGPIQSGRNLAGAAAIFEAQVEDFANALWLNRLCSLGIALIALERLLRQWVAPRERHNHGWPLILALLLYAAANHFVNGVFGTVHGLSHHAVYAVLVSLAALFAANTEPERCLTASRDALVAILLLSLAVALVQPQLVIQSGYTGGFMRWRYWGLGAHANVLSPLVVLLLALLMRFPFRRRWLTRMAFVLAWCSLLATQSKTGILSAVVMMTIFGYYRWRRAAGMHSVFQHPGLPMLVLSAAMLLALALLVFQVGFDGAGRIERFLGSRSGMEVATLTNRDQIWAFALREWRANPWFGYGPSIFDLAYRKSIGLSMAFHGHNQFMHALGAAGNVGAATLVLYFVMLAWAAFRAAAPSNGLSVALFAFVALRTITEIPLTLSSASNAEYFVHLALIVTCIGYGRRAAPARDPAWPALPERRPA